MPVATNLIRVAPAAPATCPEPLTGRNYLALLAVGGVIHAYRYLDGAYVETVRSQAMAGFGSPEFAEAAIHYPSRDVVVFGATVGGGNDGFVSWDLSAGSFGIVDGGASDLDRHCLDVEGGRFVWGWRRSGTVELYRADVGESAVVVAGAENSDSHLWGVIDDPNFQSFGSLLPMIDSSVYVPGLLDPSGEGVLALAPTGPVDQVSGLNADFALGLEIGKPHAGGSLTFADRRAEGSLPFAFGVVSPSGVFAPWTPPEWAGHLEFVSLPHPFPGGNEWMFTAEVDGVASIVALSNGAVDGTCSVPALPVEPAPEGMPEIFFPEELTE